MGVAAYFPGAAAMPESWQLAQAYSDLTNPSAAAAAAALHHAHHSTLLPLHPSAAQVPVSVSFIAILTLI